MSKFTDKTLMKEVKRALSSKKANRIRYLAPTSEAQLERIGKLMAYGPLPVREIDIDLALRGWVEIYDDEPGNESVDYTHPKSMEASDILEKAMEKFY
jgi:hypothetical protein